MIVCWRCREKKPGVAFQLDASKTSGRSGYCSPCRTIVDKERRHCNPEGYAARQRRIKARYPERFRAKAALRAELLPRAVYAREMIANEIKFGRLKRGRCEICRRAYTHGHHDDYDKPLEVRWLCPIHHFEWHEKNGPGANIEGPRTLVVRARERRDESPQLRPAPTEQG